MPAKNDQSLGQAIEAVMKRYGLQDKLEAVQVINSWERVVGSMIARHTNDLYVTKKTLYVYLDSDAIRSELSYAKSLIIKNLNKEAGNEVIVDIVFR